jgi:hypothetical protein
MEAAARSALIHCARCGAAFLPAKPWQRFCGGACRVAGHRQERRIAPDLEDALRDALSALHVLREQRTPRRESGLARELERVSAEIAKHRRRQRT